MAENNKNNKNNSKVNDQTVNAEDKVTIPLKEYEDLKARAATGDVHYDKYVRAHAEFENAKRRIEKDKQDSLRYANDSLIFQFLPIIDNLEMAEAHIKEAKDFKAVQEGVDMIQLQIQKFLKDLGIEKIRTIGEKFDPHMHEAIEVDESSDKEDGLIVAELKPGYKINGRLLRPSSVKIVKKRESDKNKF